MDFIKFYLLHKIYTSNLSKSYFHFRYTHLTLSWNKVQQKVYLFSRIIIHKKCQVPTTIKNLSSPHTWMLIFYYVHVTWLHSTISCKIKHADKETQSQNVVNKQIFSTYSIKQRNRKLLRSKQWEILHLQQFNFKFTNNILR